GSTRVFFGTAAAQNGIDASQQFTGVEWLGQVVVGAHFQANDAVDFLGLGRQHDDGRVVVAATQAAADRQTVFAGQHQVEYEQVKVLALPELAHFFRVFGDKDVEPLLQQVPP